MHKKTKHQTAALLIIGNEILSGRTRDANAWLAAERLFQQGCRVTEIVVVPDEQTMIVQALQRLCISVDAVITSGGIGPTHDDITMDCVAEALHAPLQEYDDVIALMHQRYGEQAINEGRRRMACLPTGSQMIVCQESIAPGAHIQNVYVLAGVPTIFAAQLAVILADFGSQPFLRQEIIVHLPESIFAKELAAVQAAHPDVEIGSYPTHCGAKASGKICLTTQSKNQLIAAQKSVETMLATIPHP